LKLLILGQVKFSIIITTFNSENYIENAIQSVLKQVRTPDEIIICDDNSTDRTREICSKYSSKLRIIVNENGPSGFVNAFNFALTKGSFEYISILHYDDYLSPEFLLNAEKAFLEYPECKFLYVGCNYIDKKNIEIKRYPWALVEEVQKLSGLVYAKKYLRSIKHSCHIHRCPGVIIHNSLINNGLAFRNEAGIINDDDFFLRVGKFTDILGIDYPYASVRLHIESETGKHKKLAFQLAHDWYFQYAEFKIGNSILDQEGGDLLLNYAFHDLTTALNYALKINSKEDIFEIRDILNKLELLSGQTIESIVSFFYRKYLWKLFKAKKMKRVQLLNNIILLGRRIKAKV
jgi:glycosyltransferase involved in cell wall biosynthesis